MDPPFLQVVNFNPRPPRGGRPVLRFVLSFVPPISIHALREEGDEIDIHLLGCTDVFQSTPSARRATVAVHRGNAVGVISIHALREEGDGIKPGQPPHQQDFNPRPPRGGRLLQISEELDIFLFQSTPSARRATKIPLTGFPHQRGFQSTPSARRATSNRRSARPRLSISIHALREEGDPNCEA